MHLKKATLSNKYLFCLSIGLFLISLLLLMRSGVGQESLNITFANSDSLFHTYFYQDIIVNRISISNWIFPHSFLLFPDFIIYLAVRPLFGDKYALTNLVTSIIILALVETALFTLFKKKGGLNQRTNSIFLLIIAIFNLLIGTKFFTLLYLLLLTPHFHIGTVFNVILGFIVFQRYMNQSKVDLITWAAWLAFVFIASFSDLLFFIHFTVPAFFVLATSKKDVKQKLLRMTEALSSIAGLLLYSNLPGTSVSLIRYGNRPIFWTDIFKGEILYTNFPKELLIPNCLIAVALLVLAGSYNLMLSEKDANENSQRSNLIIFVVSNFTFSMFLYLLWGYGTWEDLRVLTSVSLILVFCLFSYLSNVTGKGKSYILVCVIFLAVFTIRLQDGKKQVNNLAMLESSTIKCISSLKDRHGWDYGISDFWSSMRLTALSSGKFRLLPVRNSVYGKSLDRYIAFGDKRFENKHRIDYVYSETTFEKENAVRVLGNPENTFSCGGSQWVLYYKDGRINKLYEN